MGRDARSIVITKEVLSEEIINSIKETTNQGIDESVVGDFKCYDISYRNTCLTEELNSVNLKENCYILQEAGYNPFTWNLWWGEGKMSKYQIDTFYESEESIRDQISYVVNETEVTNSNELIDVIASFLKTNEC